MIIQSSFIQLEAKVLSNLPNIIIMMEAFSEIIKEILIYGICKIYSLKQTRATLMLSLKGM